MSATILGFPAASGGGVATMPSRVWPSGAWGSPMASSIATTTATVADTLFLSPFHFFEGEFSVSEIGVRVATGAAGNMKGGIYSYSSASDQFTLLSETAADLSTASPGFFGAALTSNVSVPSPRLLWIATVFSGLPTMSQWSPTGAHAGGLTNWIAIPNPPTTSISAPASGLARVARTTALTYVAGSAFLPATIAYSDLTISATAPGSPICYLRRA